MSEAEFSSLALKVLVPLLIGYMLLIIYRMGKDSNAGRYGMMILFIALGAGFVGFVAKGLIQFFLD